MNQEIIQTALASLPLGAVSVHASVGSTNSFAADWSAKGAPDFALVVSDEQTAGRGRGGRKWFTPPGAALAFSLVLYPRPSESPDLLPRWTALGALAVCITLTTRFSLEAQIKWPNDVLINERKVAGVLTEAHWIGDRLHALILGIGINITPQAIPQGDLDYPATSVQSVLGREVDRVRLLREILVQVIRWRALITSPRFMQAWETRLAYRGDSVQAFSEKTSPIRGKMIGLDRQGYLIIRTSSGVQHTLRAGDVHLRPVDRRTN